MKGQNCILCNKEAPTGIAILGCFICFTCEKQMLRPNAALKMRPAKRRRLAQWAQPHEC